MGAREKLKMMISWGCNSLMSVANHETAADSLKELDFIVIYDIFNNELTEGFADIVLPGVSYLEDCDGSGFAGQNFNHAYGMDDWSCHIVQPVVPPIRERRQWQTVLYDLACRLGYRDKYLETINQSGRSLQLVLLMMLVYLTISLVFSLILNWYNERAKLVER